MTDEQYEMYERCGVCCMPGIQWEGPWVPSYVFICLPCRQLGSILPLTLAEFTGERTGYLDVVAR